MVGLRTVGGFGIWSSRTTDGLDVIVKEMEASRIISRIFGLIN